MNQTAPPPDDKSKPEAGSDTAAEPRLSLEMPEAGLKAALYGAVPAGLSPQQIKDMVIKLLGDHGVKQGVLAQGVVEAVKSLAKGQALQGMVVAQGEPPEPGRDARVEVLVDLDSHRIGRLLEDGRIDFRDKGPLPLVNAGTRLAVLHPGEPGKPGLDVRGQKINPPLPRQLKLRGGTGVKIEEDGLVAVATTEGIANQPQEAKFEVLEVLEIRGDVDFASGHVDFPGKVRIAGTVLSDFKVQAKSLEAEEMEPGSSVEVSGDLSTRGGIMGAKVKAGGKITARLCARHHLDLRGRSSGGERDRALQNPVRRPGARNPGRRPYCELPGQRHPGRDNRRCNKFRRGAQRHPVGSDGRVSAGTEQSAAESGGNPQGNGRIGKRPWRTSKGSCKARRMICAISWPVSRTLPNRPIKKNLLGQVEMMKPLRNELKNEVDLQKKRLDETAFRKQALQDKLAEMEAVMPAGAVWLDVRISAEASTEIRGPRSSVVLRSQEQSFSATELEIMDEKTGVLTPVMKLRPLRSSAR